MFAVHKSLKDLSKSPMPNRTYMNENHFENGFQCLFGLTRKVCAIERLSKPPMPNRTYMNENHLKKGFQCLFGLTRKVSAIERFI